MKKIIASLLIGLFAFPIHPVFSAVSESDKSTLGQYANRATNGGAENGKTGWSVSGTSAVLGDLAIDTTNKYEGNAGFAWTPHNADNFLTNAAVTLTSNQGLSGQNCAALAYTKTASGSKTLQVYDGSNVLNSVAIPTSTTYVPVTVNFPCPASGTVQTRFGAGDTTVIYFDSHKWGDARGINLNQTLITTIPTISTVGASSHTTQFSANSSGTYTTPVGVSWIRVRMVGGGGGGGGSGTSGGGAGGNGGSTTFGSSLLTATGGLSGAQQGIGSTASGGTGTINSPAVGTTQTGGTGNGGGNGGSGSAAIPGGIGGQSAFGGGAGNAQAGQNGLAGATNSGGGGSGGGGPLNGNSGNGGGAGGFVDAIIPNPSASYSFAVGAAGTAGTAGTSGNVGGAGGSGWIEVTENYTPTTSNIYIPSSGGLAAGDITATASSSCPVGTILADGSSQLRATYPALFTALGTTYGSADGSHFNLPDYRGLFLRGVGTNATALQSNGGSVAGAALGTLQNDQVQGHTHAQNLPTITYGGGPANPGTNINGGPSNPPPVFYTNSGTGFTNPANPNSGNPTNDGANGNPRTGADTHPANLSVTYCVRTIAASPAPLLVGSVTSNSSGLEHVERASFGGASNHTSCTGTCTIYSQSGSWLSVTRTTTGSYTLTITAGEFSSAPTCTCIAKNIGTANGWCQPSDTAPTSTAYLINTYNGSNALADAQVEVICMGPR